MQDQLVWTMLSRLFQHQHSIHDLHLQKHCIFNKIATQLDSGESALLQRTSNLFCVLGLGGPTEFLLKVDTSLRSRFVTSNNHELYLFSRSSNNGLAEEQHCQSLIVEALSSLLFVQLAEICPNPMRSRSSPLITEQGQPCM